MSLVRPAVLEAWHGFSEPLEGRVHSMYLDILGLVTCGVGNLIDRPDIAAQLPWRHEKTGALATRAEVVAAWRDLKARPELAKLHWRYAAGLNDLRLTDEAIDDLVAGKLREFAIYLAAKHFRDFASWPADAQLGTLSMAWACGPGFPVKFKNFARCAEAQNWGDANACCKIREIGNPGVVPRNRANERCFLNAAVVSEHGLEPEVLHWPAVVMPPIVITPGGRDGS
jgi:hypothetical protein